MQNNFDYGEITSKAYNYLEEEFSHKYVTLHHYRSRWLPVKEFMEKRRLEFISTTVYKDFLLEFYKGRTHEELTENEKLIEKSVSVLSEFIESGSVQRKCKVRYLDGSIGLLMKDFLDYKRSRRLYVFLRFRTLIPDLSGHLVLLKADTFFIALFRIKISSKLNVFVTV